MKHQSDIKLTFVVPFASETVAKDWHQSCRLLDHTLRSLLAVPLPTAEVMVIGHEPPLQCPAMCSRRVKFLSVDYSPPIQNVSPYDDMLAKANDKGRKLEIGTKLAHSNGAAWVMHCDADDLVSAQLPQECDFAGSDAIVLRAGWKWSFGACRITRISNFYCVCGTSAILRLNKKNFPMWIGGSSYRVGEQSHGARLNLLRDVGAVVDVPRKPLAVYTVDNGCNYYAHSGKAKEGPLVRKLLSAARHHLNSCRLTDRLRREFGIKP